MPIAAPQRLRYASKSSVNGPRRAAKPCKRSQSVLACHEPSCRNCRRFGKNGHDVMIGFAAFSMEADNGW